MRVGQRVQVKSFKKNGIDHTGREGMVEIKRRFGRITVLLYKTPTMKECTVDMRQSDVRTI